MNNRVERTNIFICGVIFRELDPHSSHITTELKEHANWKLVQPDRSLLPNKQGNKSDRKLKYNEADGHTMHKIHEKNNTFHIRGRRATTVPSEVLEMRCLLSVLF